MWKDNEMKCGLRRTTTRACAPLCPPLFSLSFSLSLSHLRVRVDDKQVDTLHVGAQHAVHSVGAAAADADDLWWMERER